MTPKVIFIKNRFLKNLFIWEGFSGRCYYWFILIDDQEEPRRKLILECHEKFHISQMKRVGLLKYAWKYLFSPQFRFAVEFECYWEINHCVFNEWNNVEELKRYIRNLYEC